MFASGLHFHISRVRQGLTLTFLMMWLWHHVFIRLVWRYLQLENIFIALKYWLQAWPDIFRQRCKFSPVTNAYFAEVSVRPKKSWIKFDQGEITSISTAAQQIEVFSRQERHPDTSNDSLKIVPSHFVNFLLRENYKITSLRFLLW